MRLRSSLRSLVAAQVRSEFRYRCLTACEGKSHFGLVGVAFLGAAVLLSDEEGDNHTDNIPGEDVTGLPPEVLAACRSLQSGGLPPRDEDGTFDLSDLSINSAEESAEVCAGSFCGALGASGSGQP